MKCDCQSVTRCSNTLHMRLGSSRVLTPLKMFVKNMQTHVHKVIHLVVGTFNQGWWSLGVEELTRADRMQDRTLDRYVRSVVAQCCYSRWVTGHCSLLWPDAERGESGHADYADARALVTDLVARKWSDLVSRPVRADLTRPVTKNHLGELTVSDCNTLGVTKLKLNHDHHHA
jgi:hypothetical protein